jgi:hypothetical protein
MLSACRLRSASGCSPPPGRSRLTATASASPGCAGSQSAHRTKAALASAIPRFRHRAVPGDDDAGIPARPFDAMGAVSRHRRHHRALWRPDRLASIAILTGSQRPQRRSTAALTACRLACRIIDGYLEDRTTIAIAGLLEPAFGGLRAAATASVEGVASRCAPALSWRDQSLSKRPSAPQAWLFFYLICHC